MHLLDRFAQRGREVEPVALEPVEAVRDERDEVVDLVGQVGRYLRAREGW